MGMNKNRKRRNPILRSFIYSCSQIRLTYYNAAVDVGNKILYNYSSIQAINF